MGLLDVSVGYFGMVAGNRADQPALKHGDGLVASVHFGNTGIGFGIYHERVNSVQMIGIVLAVVALVLLNHRG